MTNVVAKMKLSSVTDTHYGPAYKSTKLRFECQYDQKLAEDVSFSKATPSGHCEMQIDNPTALEQFEVGKAYYVTFTDAP
jgi:hypothetical protein